MTTLKQTLGTNIRIITLGVLLALGASYVHAAWSEPVGTAVPGDTYVHIPINTGSVDQTRNGDLHVGTFMAESNAQFDQNLFLAGVVRGGTPSDVNSTVSFGGTDTVNIVGTGGINATSYLRSDLLANNNSKEVCATPEGVLVLCN